MKKYLQITYLINSFLLFFLLFAMSAEVFAAERKIIAVVRSRPLEAYGTAYDGFRKELKRRGGRAIYIDYDFERYKVFKEEDLADKIRNINPDLVCAIGSEAAKFAGEKIEDKPVVFFMVLDPVGSGLVKDLRHPGERMTGVSLDVPVEIQFKKTKEILPSVRTVGVIYDGRTKKGLEQEAKEAADDLGLLLVSKAVYSSSDVSRELEEVFKEADCLWAGVDTFVYNSTTGRHIILLTLKQKIPFIAFSSNFVKAGALMAFECDYYDIGVQAAELALQILKGNVAGEMSVVAPRKARLLFNVRTAKTIDVEINEKAIKEAELYGDI